MNNLIKSIETSLEVSKLLLIESDNAIESNNESLILAKKVLNRERI